MDYYQGVVTEYLRADRSLFVNTEYCIQLNPSHNPDKSGPHWYCDAVAIRPGSNEIFLCEITFSKTLHDLLKRLAGWNMYWSGVRAALLRDSNLNGEWSIQPWVFVPGEFEEKLKQGLKDIERKCGELHFQPRITALEEVQPWKYCAWDRGTKEDKKSQSDYDSELMTASAC